MISVELSDKSLRGSMPGASTMERIAHVRWIYNTLVRIIWIALWLHVIQHFFAVDMYLEFVQKYLSTLWVHSYPSSSSSAPSCSLKLNHVGRSKTSFQIRNIVTWNRKMLETSRGRQQTLCILNIIEESFGIRRSLLNGHTKIVAAVACGENCVTHTW